jgi:hypothetical protein
MPVYIPDHQLLEQHDLNVIGATGCPSADKQTTLLGIYLPGVCQFIGPHKSTSGGCRVDRNSSTFTVFDPLLRGKDITTSINPF